MKHDTAAVPDVKNSARSVNTAERNKNMARRYSNNLLNMVGVSPIQDVKASDRS